MQSTDVSGRKLSRLLVAAGCLFALSAAQAADEEIATVVVTGSRIAGNPDVLSANPISVINTADLQKSNSVDIQGVLAKMPSVGSNGLNGAESSNFGGNGFEYVDLRNLGAQRTLVLVDGQRFVTSANVGAFAGVDFNNIPTEFVDHIEILRDGASPIYGSDAVAGVINIITKKNFDGIQFGGTLGQTGKNDKDTYDASVTMGTNFDRGNIIFNVGYNKVQPIWQRNRDFAGNINNSAISSFYPNGHFTGPGFDLEGDGHGGFVQAPAVFDTSKMPNLFSGYTRTTVNSAGRYELNPDSDAFPITFVAQVMYTSRSSLGVANPDPQVGVANTPTGCDPALIPVCGTQENIGGLPGPLAPDDPSTPNTSSFPFRSTVIGARTYDTDVKTSRAVVGLEGKLFSKYAWEVKLNHGESTGEGHTLNLVDQPNLATFTGDINNLTAADLTLLRDNTTDILKTTQDVYSAQISGPAFALPAGDLNFAVGGEIRREFLTDTPDFANATGRTDQSGTPTLGKYDTKEGFVEFNVPILKDAFLAKDLSFEAAGRYSKYSNFGTAKTWKVGLNWAPTSDIRLRSSLSTSFRAPTIQELFLANTTTFIGVTDPCDTAVASSLLNTSTGAKHATVLANCAASLAAVPTGTPINPATFSPSASSQQIAGVSGGNPNLTPEKTRDLNVGLVFTPSFVSNLQVTLDYWRIHLRNQIIQTPDPQTALDLCYASLGLSDASCATLGPRTPVAISNQPAVGGISSQSLVSLNSGIIETDGIDFGLDYSFHAADVGLPDIGKFTISDVATETLSFKASDQSGSVNDFLGKIQQTSSPFTSANPKLQNRITLGWSSDAFSLSWSARFIQSVKRYTNPNAPSADCSVRGDCLPNVWYHDVVGSYTLGGYTFIAGVDNVFDKQPPYFIDTVGRTNSNPFVYDYVGRFMYVKLIAKF